jgi:hypothetical protein
MKKLLWLSVLLASACGPSVSGKGSNNGSTNGGTNGQTNGATNGGTSCLLDSDCGTDEACERQQCVPTCDDNTDCSADEVCEPGIDTELNICQPRPLNSMTNGMTNGSTNGSTNSATNSATNSGTNNTNPDALYVAMIRDQSTGMDSCGETVDDPGSDIFGAAVEDEMGNTLGWAVAVADDIVFEGNNYSGTTQLDGHPPSLNADQCPDDFSSDTVTSLGCGGWIGVTFWDADGQVIPLVADSGQRIRVYEYGAQCLMDSAIDTYGLFLCTDTEAARAGDDSSCTIEFYSDITGEFVVDVSGF